MHSLFSTCFKRSISGPKKVPLKAEDPNKEAKDPKPDRKAKDLNPKSKAPMEAKDPKDDQKEVPLKVKDPGQQQDIQSATEMPTYPEWGVLATLMTLVAVLWIGKMANGWLLKKPQEAIPSVSSFNMFSVIIPLLIAGAVLVFLVTGGMILCK